MNRRSLEIQNFYLRFASLSPQWRNARIHDRRFIYPVTALSFSIIISTLALPADFYGSHNQIADIKKLGNTPLQISQILRSDVSSFISSDELAMASREMVIATSRNAC